MGGPSPFGLSRERRSQLLERLVSRRGGSAFATQAAPARAPLGDPQLRADMRRIYEAGRILGIENPYFRAHDGIAGAETSIGGRRLLNLVS